MIAGHSLGGTIAGYIASEGDKVTTLDKAATIGQCIRKNEKAYRVSGDVVSALHKSKEGMTTLLSSKDTANHIRNRLPHTAPLGHILARAKEVLDSHLVDKIKDSGIDVE